jgi:hypothetical protein
MYNLFNSWHFDRRWPIFLGKDQTKLWFWKKKRRTCGTHRNADSVEKHLTVKCIKLDVILQHVCLSTCTIQQDIISMGSEVFVFYHKFLFDMLDLQNFKKILWNWNEKTSLPIEIISCWIVHVLKHTCCKITSSFIHFTVSSFV